jgi:SPP1 gp7 family putative phage head morphogenesis protein
MPEALNLAYALDLPPEKAIAYFEAKGYAFSWDWREVWQEAHAQAFTVAGVLKSDVLQDIRAGVEQALKEGKTLSQFERELEPLLKKRGWLGKGEVRNAATGEVEGRRLAPQRMATIYRTNMQTSYMAGRYKSFAENAAARPYWEYVAVMDARTRPEHAALNGLVFPAGDAFWNSYWPPNGYRCRCRVSALTAREAKAEGVRLESSDGRITEKEVPVGRSRPGQPAPKAKVASFELRPGLSISPDPGFSYNPGKAAWPELQDVLARKMETAPQRIASGLARGQALGPGFKEFHAAPSGNWPIAKIPPEDAKAIGSQTGTVLLSADTMKKQLREHAELAPEEYAKAQAAIDAGTKVRDSAHSLVYILEEIGAETGGYVTVVKATRTGQAVFLTSLRRLSHDDVKRNMEVQRLLQKAKK